MSFSEIITNIFQVCIIPLLGVLTTYLVKWIQARSQEIQTNIDNELTAKYMQMLTQTITDCVIATKQTYVESLKQQGKFDLEAQKQAFQMTLDAVLNLLTEDAVECLQIAVGDLNLYITTQIEAKVNETK